MGYSFQHQGAALPVRLELEQHDVDEPCPMCLRADYDGRITFPVEADRGSGVTPARCSRGHMVMVTWSRTSGG